VPLHRAIAALSPLPKLKEVLKFCSPDMFRIGSCRNQAAVCHLHRRKEEIRGVFLCFLDYGLKFRANYPSSWAFFDFGLQHLILDEIKKGRHCSSFLALRMNLKSLNCPGHKLMNSGSFGSFVGDLVQGCGGIVRRLASSFRISKSLNGLGTVQEPYCNSRKTQPIDQISNLRTSDADLSCRSSQILPPGLDTKV